MSKVTELMKSDWVFPKHNDKNAGYVLKPGRAKEIIGMDTETDLGRPFLFTYSASDEDEGYALVNDENWLEVLTNKKFRGTINFFYNLGYDAEGFIKYLPDNLKIDLNRIGTVFYRGYKISYIKEKRLRITRGKNVYTFFDLFQYFHTSLEKAGERFVGAHKTGDYGATMDYQRFLDDVKYRETIIEYCIQDSALCRKLGEFLFSDFVRQGFKNYMSSASLSEEYFRKQGLPLPPAIDEKILRMFLQSYYGGRFEALKKGEWHGNIKEYDINSAYPAVMAEMPILTKNYKIKEGKGWDFPLYGCYQIKVWIPEEAYYGLLPYRFKEEVVYPVEEMEAYVTYPEMAYIDALGLDYEIVHSIEVYDESAEPKLHDPIHELYKKKKKAEKDKDEVRRMQYKLILNSLYGKFIQSTQKVKLEPVKATDDDKDDDELVCINGELYKVMKEKEYKLGMLFNPIYASHITASVRCKLIENFGINDKSLFSFATDSVLTTKCLDTGSWLGEWTKDEQGDCVIFGCGRYKIGDKVRNRGVANKKVHTGTVIEKRRLSLAQAVQQDRLQDLNLIEEVPITLTDKDCKRYWYSVDKEKQDSEPLLMSDIIEKERKRDYRDIYRYRKRYRNARQYVRENEIDEAYLDSSLTDRENLENLKGEWKRILEE